VSISFAGHKYETYVKIRKQAKHKAYLSQEMEEGPNTYGFWGAIPIKMRPRPIQQLAL
jgi:ABC-type cobalamin transport system ATPase subunit